MSAGFVGRHVAGFEDLRIDVFLEVRNKRYSYILYLIEYIAYGLHLCDMIFWVKYSRKSVETLFPTFWLSDKSEF